MKEIDLTPKQYLEISFDDLLSRLRHEVQTKFSYMTGFGELFLSLNTSITSEEYSLMKDILNAIWETFHNMRLWLDEKQTFFLSAQEEKNIQDYSQANSIYEREAKSFFDQYHAHFKEPLFELSQNIAHLFAMRDNMKLHYANNFFNSFNDIYFILLNSQHYKDTSCNKTPVSASQIINSTLSELSSRCEEKEITIEHTSEQLHILVDLIKYKHIIFEIIKNAIMHSPIKGKVIISAKVTQYQETDFFMYEVVDQGDGFLLPKHYSILDYARVGTLDFMNHSSTSFGMGFGLFNVNHWSNLHNGHVEVVNSSESGGKIRIYIPL